MKQQDISVEAFQVIGIKTRTSNSDEMNGAGKISGLWNKFYSEQLLNQIPGRIDQDVLAVYHDYQSDANAPYSLLVGARVAAGTKPPAGMELLSIPASKYQRLTTRQGEMPGIVIEAWQDVWARTAQGALNRKYTYDFELYDNRCANPMSAEVDLLIAVKS